jgi:integrase
MASVISDPKGRKRLQFTAADGMRRTIRLGKATVRQAEAIKVKVEQLVLTSTGLTDTPDDETVRWLAGLDEVTYDKFAAVGLVSRRESIKLGAFLDDYIKGRHDVKAGTTTVYGHTRRNLLDFFGADKLLRDITPGDADQYRLYLIGQGLADNTVRRRCGFAKQFFRVAVRRKLITSNPFGDLKSSAHGNPQRFYFITREEAQKVLDACPDAQWRLIFALSRYGGLRCPSEHLGLRWSDIDWERGRMLVRSPKTEHHQGHESRLVPLFPELLPYLREVFEGAEPGTEHVITLYQQHTDLRACNMRTQFERIIAKAGLKPWPKLFQNLRSTRETELAEKWPEHVVCAWIGNSKAVAKEHYLQVTDQHFERAVRMCESTDEAAQKAAQQDAAEPCVPSLPDRELAKFDVTQGPATPCEYPMDRVGFEPT